MLSRPLDRRKESSNNRLLHSVYASHPPSLLNDADHNESPFRPLDQSKVALSNLVLGMTWASPRSRSSRLVGYREARLQVAGAVALAWVVVKLKVVASALCSLLSGRCRAGPMQTVSGSFSLFYNCAQDSHHDAARARDGGTDLLEGRRDIVHGNVFYVQNALHGPRGILMRILSAVIKPQLPITTHFAGKKSCCNDNTLPNRTCRRLAHLPLCWLSPLALQLR
jgi:hypothetical protein